VTLRQLIATHPQPGVLGAELLVSCVEACGECADACTSCADACLAEEGVQELRRCIRLDLDCADLCGAVARIVTRQTATELRLLRPALEACIAACGMCADECERHVSHHEHCRVCAEACRRCEQACRELLGSIA
jgi:Domain of Unknown Function (DUF326)